MTLGLHTEMTTLDLLSTGDLVFSDITGSYSSNPAKYPTGYGNPDGADREDLALFLRVANRRTTGDTPVVLEEYDPETVTGWRGEYLQQGLYVVNLKAVQKLEQDIDSARFAVGEIVYDFSLDELRRVTVVTEDEGSYTFTTVAATEDELFSGDYAEAAQAVQFKSYLGELKTTVVSLRKRRHLTPRESSTWTDLDKHVRLAEKMLDALCDQSNSVKSYEIFVKNVETAEEYFAKHFSYVL